MLIIEKRNSPKQIKDNLKELGKKMQIKPKRVKTEKKSMIENQ